MLNDATFLVTKRTKLYKKISNFQAMHTTVMSSTLRVNRFQGKYKVITKSIAAYLCLSLLIRP
jgi:hypothetical protein